MIKRTLLDALDASERQYHAWKGMIGATDAERELADLKIAHIQMARDWVQAE